MTYYISIRIFYYKVSQITIIENQPQLLCLTSPRPPQEFKQNPTYKLNQDVRIYENIFCFITKFRKTTLEKNELAFF